MVIIETGRNTICFQRWQHSAWALVFGDGRCCVGMGGVAWGWGLLFGGGRCCLGMGESLRCKSALRCLLQHDIWNSHHVGGIGSKEVTMWEKYMYAWKVIKIWERSMGVSNSNKKQLCERPPENTVNNSWQYDSRKEAKWEPTRGRMKGIKNNNWKQWKTNQTKMP
jgi:hypothetical protein